MDAAIQVSIRMRPFLNSESMESSRWKIADKRMISLKENPTHSFQFDHIFDERASTEEIYSEICSPIIQSYLEGFNATIFVYGQTASGKSFTMLGDGTEANQSFGIIPSSLFEMFDLFGQRPNRQYLLSVSYMEIYNEKITDLLNTSNSSVKIREDRNGSVAVTSLTEVACKNIDDVIQVLSAGNANRTIGETNFNLRSSRAHTIFTLQLESRDITAENSSATVSALNLVDLAGSERPSSASTNETQRFKEGTYINSSLLALGNVISSLSEGRSHVPYRDSKLTRILQSSLGGNSKTLIICTTSPSSVDETISTLRFASRAKKIKNKPIINEVMTMEQVLRKEVLSLTEENHILTEKLKSSSNEDRNDLLGKLQVLDNAKSEAEKKVLVLEQRLREHIISTETGAPQPTAEVAVTRSGDNLKDRRRTYFVNHSPGIRDCSIFLSPLLKSAVSRRRTLFETRPKDITFVKRGSLMTEGDEDTESPARTLQFEERKVDNSMQTETKGFAQTYPSVVDSCTQATPTAVTPPQTSDAQIQTNMIVHNRPDQCVFTDLDQSYQCLHRTHVESTTRALENALFVNDEYSIQFTELKEMTEQKETAISELEVKLKIREEANEAQEEMLCGLQTKLKGMTNETQLLQERLRKSSDQEAVPVDKIQELEKVLSARAEKIDQLEMELKAQDQKTISIEKMETNIRSLEKENLALASSRNEIRENYRALVLERENLDQHVAMLTTKFEDAERSIEQLVTDHQKCKMELEKAKLDCVKGKDLFRENTKLKELLKLSDDKLVALKAELQGEYSHKYESFETRLSQEVSDNDQLKQKNVDLETKIERLTIDLHQLKGSFEEKFVEMEDSLLKEQIKSSEFSKENSDLKTAIESSGKELCNLKTKVEEQREMLTNYSQLEKELSKARSIKEEMTKTNATLKRSIETLTKELKTSEMCLQESEETLNNFLGIEKELAEEQTKSMELSAENIKLKRELEALNDSHSQGLHEKSAKDIRYLELALEESEECLGRFQGIEQELSESEETCNKLTKENEELKASLESVNKEIHYLKMSYKESEECLGRFQGIEQELSESEETCNKLTKENEELKDSLESVNKEIHYLKMSYEENEECLGRFQGIEQELSEFEETCNKLTKENEELKASLERQEREMHHLKRTIESRQQEPYVGVAISNPAVDVPQDRLKLVQELCGLRQENKKLVMKIRFLSSNIPINPRVGVVNSPEVAGYHKLIEELEMKNKKLKSVVLKYQQEINELHKQSELKQSHAPPQPSPLSHSGSEEHPLPTSQPSNPPPSSENEAQHTAKPQPPLVFDWEQSIISSDPDRLVPFDVYEQTPEKPPSHPSECRPQ